MAVYIVTYDLNKEAKRPNILAEIKKRAWAKLSESSYAIKTVESTEAVFTALRPFIDDNDNLYVITIKRPYTGWGQKDVNEWLENNLEW